MKKIWYRTQDAWIEEMVHAFQNSFLAICVVYAGENVDASNISPNHFLVELADQLIESSYDQISLRHRDI